MNVLTVEKIQYPCMVNGVQNVKKENIMHVWLMKLIGLMKVHYVKDAEMQKGQIQTIIVLPIICLSIWLRGKGNVNTMKNILIIVMNLVLMDGKGGGAMKCPECGKKREFGRIPHIFLDNGEILLYSKCSCGYIWYVYDTKLWDRKRVI